MQKSYKLSPALGIDKIFFVSENCLWSVDQKGGTARRLVVGQGVVSKPIVSPDGKLITFSFTEEGSNEVYVMPSDGGTAKRLTYHNHPSIPAGWSRDSKTIYFSSSMKSKFMREPLMFSVSIDGGNIEPMNIGSYVWIDIHEDGDQVLLGKNSTDLSYWKRYKGGTAGKLFYGKLNTLNIKQLIKDEFGYVRPQFDNDRIYFLSDRDGIGNIYSMNTKGGDIKAHTDHKDFYARNLSVRDGKAVYQMGGEIYHIDLKSNKTKKIKIDTASPLKPERSHFTLNDQYIHDVDISNDGENTLLTVRGKLTLMPNWFGASKVLGKKQGVRYRLAKFLNDDQDIICASDEGDKERVELHYGSYIKDSEVLATMPEGRVKEICPSNDGKSAVVVSSRGVFYMLDVEKKSMTKFDKTDSTFVGYKMSWSPDDRYIAYTKIIKEEVFESIFIYDTKDKEIIKVTNHEFEDYNPEFDPDGKYLYFASKRHLDPYIDHRDLNFIYPYSSKAYLLVLDKDTPIPFLVPHAPEDPNKKPDDESEDEENNKNDKNKTDKKDEEKKPEVKIDKDGLSDRIFEFPVDPSSYYHITGLKDKVILSSVEPEGMMGEEFSGFKMDIYNFVENKSDDYMNDVKSFHFSRGKKWILFKQGEGGYTVRKAAEKLPPDVQKAKPNQIIGGAIDTGKISIRIDLKTEWKQIFRETWNMEKEFFWNEGMSGVNWDKVKKKYEPLVDMVNTREELSDILWEVQGELGTSHAYISGGELQGNKGYQIGLLGADFDYDKKKSLYKVSKIYKGDTFQKDAFSPLLLPGVNVKEGSYIHAINGDEIQVNEHPNKYLMKTAGKEVTLTVSDNGTIGDAREVVVPTISTEQPLVYRDWVNHNIDYVSKKTKGEVGYFHIPNMSLEGLLEFDRYFHSNINKKGLVLDIRCNGGGFTSQYFLQKLYRRLVGFVNTRWCENLETLPQNTFRGSLVVIIDENAGSDGDIFPRSFKNLKMGTVVGKRTWGGVVGIGGSELNVTADNGMSTQPRFAIWFTDQKYSVENHGVEPDVEVDNDPKSVNKGKDNQLDVALDELKKLMDKNGYYEPDFGPITKTAYKGK